MRWLLIVLLLAIPVKVFSQHNIIDSNSDYQSYQEQLKRQYIPEIRYSKHNYHFRLSSNPNIIEVWLENNCYYGSFTTMVYECVNEHKENQTRRVFKESISLTQQQIHNILHLIDSTDIESVPTHDSLNKIDPTWLPYMDGTTVYMEFNKNNIYSFKSYPSPDMYKKIQEARLITKFHDRCLEIANADSVDKLLIRKMPFQCYSRGGNMRITFRGTSKQDRKYRRERDAYRKSVGIKNRPER